MPALDRLAPHRSLMARRLIAAAALACCAAASAQTTTFTGSGAVQPTGEVTPPGVLSLFATGSYEFAGFGTWSLVAGFLFDTAAGTGAGGFVFSQGTDSFGGTLSSSYAPIALGPGFEMSYTITEGTGALAGVFGTANSVIRLTGDLSGPPPYAYLEAGIVSVTIPPVPEPATWLMMLGGAAALAGLRKRAR